MRQYIEAQQVDMGNNEVATVGVVADGDGYLALTFTASKSFKTRRGAVAWLARRGFTASGQRIGTTG
jgi:hypothetical protein